jgi:S1-C subfamily serine protease
VSGIAAKVDPALVDINTELYSGGRAAGTGIVLTSNGEVVTNNHVIDGATSISVTDVGNGRTYSADVVGYDRTGDIAVIQLLNASGLTTASIGNSDGVSVGDQVVALGNAGGTGGTPSEADGQVTALNQSITASDAGAGTSENLTGLIQTNAALQPGDSGGSLVDSSGRVIGIDTAASEGFSFQGSGQGYAIPIKTALGIAQQIAARQTSSTIHIGPTAFLGVEIQPSSSSANIGSGSSGSGATLAGVIQGQPAAQAGLAAGDVITSLGGKSIDSPETLSAVVSQYKPQDKVELGWTDTSGGSHTATIQLATGPAA